MKIKKTRVPQNTSTRKSTSKKGYRRDATNKLHLRANTVIVIKETTPMPVMTPCNEQELPILQVASGQ